MEGDQEINAAIYCRVSTEDQEREGTSLQTQLEACRQYCQDKGYQIAYQFTETYSGLTLDRPRLCEVRELVRDDKINKIVVYCLDRLSRDPTDGVILTEELEDHGVSLEAVSESIETSDLGKLISYIRGFASKLEAQKIRERTMRGKLAYLKNGKLPQGTGIGLYGYHWDKSRGRRVIIEHEADTVRRIFSMVISGMSMNQIAISLNKSQITTKSGLQWNHLVIKRIISNPAYAGLTYFGRTKRVTRTKVTRQPEERWILLADITPAIITKEIFDQAQKSLADSKQRRALDSHTPYLLTGFIRCSKCGSTVGGTTLSGKYRYYQCRGARPTSTRDKICDQGYIKADEVESFVWSKFTELYANPLVELNLNSHDSGIDIKPILDKQITHMRKKLKTYAEKEKQLYELLSYDHVTKDYVLDTIAKLRHNQEEDRCQLDELLQSRKLSKNHVVKTVPITKFVNICEQSFAELTIQEKREFLQVAEVKVLASPNNYKFTCYLDTEAGSDSQKPYPTKWLEQQIEDFNQANGDINNLVTIEQTSA